MAVSEPVPEFGGHVRTFQRFDIFTLYSISATLCLSLWELSFPKAY